MKKIKWIWIKFLGDECRDIKNKKLIEEKNIWKKEDVNESIK